MKSPVLYTYWRSSSSFRVRFALNVKRVAYESRPVNLLKGEQRSETYLATNPNGFVPCLVIDGEPVVESVAIIELLDDLIASPKLFPSDPIARARVRALVEAINSGVQPLQNLSVLDHVSSDTKARTEWAQHFIKRGLNVFELMMKANADRGVLGPFAYGETLTAADIFLVPQLYASKRFGVDLAPFPRLRAAGERAAATDAAIAAAPENQSDAPPDEKRTK